MREVIPNLFVGNQDDAESRNAPSVIVHACKEPYHRSFVGYTGKAAPLEDPEYLYAVRGSELALNLVDSNNPAFVSREIINAALIFIHRGLQSGRSVLVHCNQGRSRSPSIALLYMVSFAGKFPDMSFVDAEAVFRVIYPEYAPAAGIRGFVETNWDWYANPHRKEWLFK